MSALVTRRRVVVRRLTGADDDEVRRLFDETVLLGRPFRHPVVELERYRELCLGWYLGPGRADAAVAVDDDERVVGYALVCVDEQAAARWARRHALGLAGRIAGRAMRLELDVPSQRFYGARARDGLLLWRRHGDPVAPVHAHVNVVPGRRNGSATLGLLAHIDERCRRAGASAWYGEVNERPGRRAGALGRIGLEVVRRDPNRTLSALLDTPVERLTVRRVVS